MREGSNREERRRLAAAILLALAFSRPAVATFHFMLIVEVFVASAAAPDAQYVVLQMYSMNQTQVGDHPVTFYDANGALVDTVTFADDVGNGADDANILIATSTAEALFGVAADLRVPSKMPAAGGKFCFDSVDCFAWGGYSGSPTGVGAPFSDFGDDVAAVRLITGALDESDDTDNSEFDFQSESQPLPRNNAGEFGAPNADALFLDGFEDNGFGGWSAVEPPEG